jgi:hypothetical protein
MTISDVDYAPNDLPDQTPFDVDLMKQMPGPDRPDYWLGRLRRPLRWSREGTERSITHIVLSAKWVGMEIGRDRQLPVGIAYVTDSTLLHDAELKFEKCTYVAIGMAREADQGRTSWRVLLAVLMSLLVLLAIGLVRR